MQKTLHITPSEGVTWDRDMSQRRLFAQEVADVLGLQFSKACLLHLLLQYLISSSWSVLMWQLDA